MRRKRRKKMRRDWSAGRMPYPRVRCPIRERRRRRIVAVIWSSYVLRS